MLLKANLKFDTETALDAFLETFKSTESEDPIRTFKKVDNSTVYFAESVEGDDIEDVEVWLAELVEYGEVSGVEYLN